MYHFTIKSSNTSASLTFCERDGDYYSVIYDSPAIKLKKRVWGYSDGGLLVDLFAYIAKQWKGWDGLQTWGSIEEDFGLSASCDHLGHVMLHLSFIENDGPEVWQAKVDIGLDSGQMDEVADNVRHFFRDKCLNMLSIK
ncbi:DUF6228 family protein [Motilimonas cestriensis]|uniref:DUF6228 family protein n=1 Tax=Motilimonas cestriensis TaxID=2742685 RepID=A0ABS8W9L4_9GAMM|nr:DUF6228 family protein [Motilimonas cestriensis]MCE2594792.1 DUF6228 family protein [Motilimonas cestriensis]